MISFLPILGCARRAAFLRRRAAAGYRFLANLIADDDATAREAMEVSHPNGGLLLIERAFDARGRPLAGARALYVRNDLSEPTSFWSYFGYLKQHRRGEGPVAGAAGGGERRATSINS